MDKAMAKYIFPTLFTAVSMSLLSGCVTQSFENNEPIVKTQANRDEMAATRISLGLGYLKMGDMSQAKLNLEKAKKFSPNLVQVHTAFAHYYETVGESKLAIDSFEQALLIKADSADTLNNYGVFLCRQDQVAAAEVQFLKAIAVPSYLLVAQSYENLASCYLQDNDFDKAEMYLNKAIFHSPNRTTTLLQMVRLQYAMAEYKEGKRFLQKFERNTQRFSADSLALSYKLYRKLGKRRTASNYANMLVKMYPQSWEGKQYLLNELEFIEADSLADKYKSSQKQKNKHLPSSGNKRVVKLSPKKATNSAYSGSFKTINSPKNSVNATTVKSTVSDTSAIVATVPHVSATVTQPILDTSATLLSTTVAGTSATKSTVAAVTAIGSVAGTTDLISNAVANKAARVEQPVVNTTETVLTTEVTEQVNTPALSGVEPTSTQPIAATRDVPLPEALPEVLPESVETEVVVPESVNNTEEAAVQEAEVQEAEVQEVEVQEAEVQEVEVQEVEVQEVEVQEVEVQEALHTVKSGENLYSISMKYNVKLSALRKWNNISEKNKIRIGKKLYVIDPQTVNKN